MNSNTIILDNFHEAIVIINSANLYSSICDCIHMVHLYNDYFKMDNIYVIIDNRSVIEKVDSAIEKYHAKVTYVVSNDLKDSFAETVRKIGDNFIISISSHGYASGDHNYIHWNGKIIHDYDFHDILISNMKPNLQCFILVDTCQSGTMFNLNYQTKDMVVIRPENLSECKLDICCIGAVDDSEYDQDDLSDYGYGGGLSCSFIDFINEKLGKTIGEFFIYYKNRIAVVSHHPVLSYNCLDFIK